MKSLFGDDRVPNLLMQLHKTPMMTVSSLASRFGVSERTIRNDIKQINQELQDCAVIEGIGGKYNLRVFQEKRFLQLLAEMMQTDDFMNSSRNRMDYIFGRLMRAEQPVLTDDLAYEMNVGRTTLMGDLKKLREEIQPYRIEIIGKTSKGLILSGKEMDIRKYVLDGLYETIYREYPLDPELRAEIEQVFRANHFEKCVRTAFEHSVTLMLDRFLNGHDIGMLPQNYYDLTARQEFAIIDALMDRFSEILHIRIPVEEKLFVFLPVIGMRTPADIHDARAIELDETVRPLMRRILRVRV